MFSEVADRHSILQEHHGYVASLIDKGITFCGNATEVNSFSDTTAI